MATLEPISTKGELRMAAMFDKEQLLMGSNIGVLATVGPLAAGPQLCPIRCRGRGLPTRESVPP